MAAVRFLQTSFLFLLAGILVSVSGQPPALAGDHPVAKPIVVSPRIETRFDDKQLVLVYANRQLYEDKPIFNFGGKRPIRFADPRLVVFLEDYIDGTPTTGAQIELVVNFLPQPLTETAPGIYQSEKVILGGGRNEIEVSYAIGEDRGTLTLMLLIPAGATSTTSVVALNIPPPPVPGWVYAVGALVIYLIVTALFWARRPARQNQAKHG